LPVSRTRIHRGRVVDFGLESIAQPDGRILEIEVARHPGGAAVVAVDEQRRVCLLRQFRAPFEDWLWELPAGKVDRPEAPRATAERELAEEAGLAAGRWRDLGFVLTCPGFSDEVIHLFLATDLAAVAPGTEPDEFIEVHWWPLDHAEREARTGQIQDAKTVVGLLRAAALLRGGTASAGA
jgi:ADP-ribose pyrophosphatase